METKNSKRRKGLLVAGIVFGLAGWGTIAWGYSNQNQEAPGSSDESGRIMVDETKKANSKEGKVKEDTVLTEETVEPDKEEENPDAIAGVTQESGEAIKEKEEKEIRRIGDIFQLESDLQLDTTIGPYITQWAFLKGRVIKIHLTENLDKLDGVYVYSANILKVGEVAELDLGFITEKVPSKLINSYKDFYNKPQDLKKDSNAIALVDYKDGKIIEVDLYHSRLTRDEIQRALLKIDIIKKEDFSTADEQKALKGDSHEYLTVDDWKGMSLLANRDIINSGMAPIFIVPITALRQDKGDLEGTFYYVVGGMLFGGDPDFTSLLTYEGKRIDLDFGMDYNPEDFGKPVWMHVITQDGVVENVEVQTFDGANIKTMSEGMLSFIGVASAELNKE